MRNPRTSSHRRLAVVVAFVTPALVALPGPAAAEDKAGAAELFAEAGRLVDSGQAAAACPKYEESLRLHDGINTRYFLADCYERTGRAASAWALFLEVAARAGEVGDEAKEAKARERAADARRHVSELTIVVDGAGTPGIAVTRGGAPVGPGQWGVSMPVDPGETVVEASAPGRRTWSVRAAVAPDGQSVRVVVPRLEIDASSAAEGAPGASATWSARRVAAVIAGGVGLASVAAGSALALSAKGTFDDARAFCNGDRCDALGMDLRDTAVTRANVATVVFAAGVVAVGAGAVLWITAPRVRTGGPAIGLSATPGALGMRGTF